MPYKEPDIIETIPILVCSREENEYGDLIFTDENGVEYKLKQKRVEKYGSMIQLDRMVELHFAEFRNNKYIHSIKMSEAPPPDTTSATVENKLVDHAVKQGAVIDKPSGQEIGMTTKEIGDMIRAEKLSAIFGAEIAIELAEWYKARIKSTTGVK